VSSRNLLWVSHHIQLKIKNHKQSATHNMCNSKVNSHQESSTTSSLPINIFQEENIIAKEQLPPPKRTL